ncbi:BAAT/acyl-CoA thioester hydrolase protein [Oesophagostomum dentatum]|uniref:BAAT/acyl-CoA thioester hydrolase protein n=1 Tax=Oesophagostomum dentatum TaxID=61180 RepID=A0A0B1RUM8_OESDE|nr:BAAT/acyl-CoA thioester hydrolase protein [Oesophagostomum dentatum]
MVPHIQSDYINIKENGKLLPQPDLFVSKFVNSFREADRYHYFINRIVVTDKVIQHAAVSEETEIPWHRIPKSTSFRLVVCFRPETEELCRKMRAQGSVDDLVSSSVFATRYMAKRLAETGHEVEVHLVNGGHIMEPPYFPHHDKVFAKFQGFCCGYGGEVVLHGKSQEASWAGTIDFFTRKLGQPATMPDWDRLGHEEIRSNL